MTDESMSFKGYAPGTYVSRVYSEAYHSEKSRAVRLDRRFYFCWGKNNHPVVNKSLLKENCIAIIRERMNGLQNAMKESQEAANEETKSSSGDKYETTRAMNQLDKDMYARQLAENSKELAAIMETDCEKKSLVVEAGSIVKCDHANFFILAGLGKIEFERANIFVISPNAPLAKAMFGKVKGETIFFNKQQMLIKEVY
jgi:transcription elongation GreA/GreB family factor